MIKTILTKLNKVKTRDMKIMEITLKSQILGVTKKVVAGLVITGMLVTIGYQNWVYHNMLKISKAQQGTVSWQIKEMDSMAKDIYALENPSSPEAMALRTEIDNLCKDLWVEENNGGVK